MSTVNQKSSDFRLIVNWDENAMWKHQLQWLAAKQGKEPAPETVKAMLERIVDEHAKAKIDCVVHCLFSLPWGPVTAGFKTFERAPNLGFIKNCPGMRGLEDAGYDRVQVLLDRSRKAGIRFFAGLRMNDRHANSDQQPFCRNNPQWQLEPLKGQPGGPGRGLDYKYEGVRRAMTDFTAELLERYDVDGLELDWIRHCHVFNPDEAEQNAGLLTDFMAQMRRVLDQAARRRGRGKLPLGVIIPQSIEECRVLGFDVKTWVRHGLVDYICPSDFFFIDFNIRVEDFVKLTEGTNCKVFPVIHAATSIDNARRGLSRESLRAAATNHYEYGAHGIAAYNFYNQYGILLGGKTWEESKELLLARWTEAFGYLTALRDPQAAKRGDKHYFYHPLWPNDFCNAGVLKRYTIELTRDGASANDALRLRVAERLESPHLTATLQFKVTGMTEKDQIEIQINSQTIPAGQVERSYKADGQSADEGRVIPAFFLYRTPLSSPPAKFGDNEVRIRLTKSSGTQKLIGQEFEILLKDKRSAPTEDVAQRVTTAV